MKLMKVEGIPAYIGYVPLHSSKMGMSLGNEEDDLLITQDLASRIVRMPMYAGMSRDELQYILQNTKNIILKKWTTKASGGQV